MKGLVSIVSILHIFCVSYGVLSGDNFSNVGIENGTATPYDVIVVGLGAAGVSALASLARAGRSALGLEAAGRLGGRVRTVEFGRGVVELGAEWIHGENSSLTYELAVKNGVPIRIQSYDFELRQSDGTKLDQDTAEDLMTYCVSLIGSPSEERESKGRYFTRKIVEHIANITSLANDTDFIGEFLEFANQFVNLYDGSDDWYDAATDSNFENLAGNQDWSWHTFGYRTLFDILLNKYNNGTGLPVDIKLNKEVSSIQWSKDAERAVTVRCTDETTYSAKSVIVTVSLGVLKERYNTLFDPKLPDEKINAIKSLTIGVVDKIVFSYDSAWWPKPIFASSFVWKGEHKTNITKEDLWTTKFDGFSVPFGSENCITLWLTGETAKLVETLPDDVVIRKCTETIRRFFGPQVPEPTAVIRSAWYSDPLTRGSYTFDSVNMTDSARARAALAAPVLDDADFPKLLFAGEATNQKHFSTVHGAVETGVREAEYVLNVDPLVVRTQTFLSEDVKFLTQPSPCLYIQNGNTPYDVIVVGLGASGISALSSLARAGRSVLGLEAADRLGGRVRTVEFGTGIVEVGAEWIHGERSSPTFELAVKNNVPIRKQEFKTSLHRSDGSQIENEIAEDLINFCVQVMDSTPDKAEPYGVFFTRKFEEHLSSIPALVNDTDFKDGFLEFSNRMVDVLEASNDWNDISSVQEYEMLEGDQQWSWHVLGYRTLFDLLLVSLHDTLFDPKLPEEKISAINTVEIGVVDKIIFSYDTKWWQSEYSFFGFIWNNRDRNGVAEEDAWTRKIYGFSTPLGSENVITLWVTGEAAKHMETLPEDVVRTKCTELLRKFLGSQIPEPTAMISMLYVASGCCHHIGDNGGKGVINNRQLPTPLLQHERLNVQAPRSTWYSNPLTRGSYTHDGINVTDPTGARLTLAAPLLDTAQAPRLLFAGEATNPNHYSTVHGAVETGLREARNVLNHLENSGTTR
ncbi:hypothetical protein EVAR_62609_1 [Eumeta japonica]|uniref:Amine oxidase domain-containing protein n=1 Tax=Eumeta variegata TaxID=151549 RepID=A0A4C1ZE10_EUMVA|nr:hypothetical protein EVAR_62609_1 [Eumeta japonica]